jgi:hypothetical protein
MEIYFIFYREKQSLTTFNFLTVTLDFGYFNHPSGFFRPVIC